jgi:phosphoadenosine phosphosulfate reductase
MTAATQKKVDFARSLILKVAEKDNIQFSNSGGKDSAVVYHIIKSLGLENKIPIVYCNTTIDPRGTIAYIKRNMPETKILHPKENFYKIIERKGVPTRRARFCCEILKEYASIGKLNIEGVRSAESQARQGRDYITCDRRKKMKGCQHCYPIYDFTDAEVYEYIRENGIVLHEWYSLGFTRLGCIGCPQAGKARMKEFELYPKMVVQIKKSIKKAMDTHQHWKLSKRCKCDADKAFAWWISEKSIDNYFLPEFEF